MTKVNPKYNSYLQHVVATVELENVSKGAEERVADVQEDLEVTDVKGNKGVSMKDPVLDFPYFNPPQIIL